MCWLLHECSGPRSVLDFCSLLTWSNTLRTSGSPAPAEILPAQNCFPLPGSTSSLTFFDSRPLQSDGKLKRMCFTVIKSGSDFKLVIWWTDSDISLGPRCHGLSQWPAKSPGWPWASINEWPCQPSLTNQLGGGGGGGGIAQWLERRTRDRKVAGSNPCWSGGIIFFSRVDFLCWLLFRYPFHPRVTAVARKRSRSFCQKCTGGRLQLNTHTPYVCGFAWSDTVHGCMVYTELAPRRLQFHVAPAMPAL